MSESFVFRFKKEKLESGKYVSRPKVPVKLVGKNASLNFIALLDSGADVSVIPQAVADALGLVYDIKHPETLYGHREKSESYESAVDLVFRTKRGMASISNVPVVVVPSDGDFEVILGVAGIFDHFSVTFDRSHNKITLRRAGQAGAR